MLNREVITNKTILLLWTSQRCLTANYTLFLFKH